MSGEPSDDDGTGTVVIGRSGVRAAYALLLVGVVGTALTVRLELFGGLFVFVSLVVSTTYQLVVRGQDELRLEQDAMVVRSRTGSTRYAWSDVLEVAWRPSGDALVGPGPVLRVRGGPWDEPGPNLPAQVARLPVFGRHRNAAAAEALERAARRHGVRYDPRMERDIATGRRRPQDPERTGQ